MEQGDAKNQYKKLELTSTLRKAWLTKFFWDHCTESFPRIAFLIEYIPQCVEIIW